MEEANKTSARSITPIDSFYNTETDKEFFSSLDRNYTNAKSHKRVTSNDFQYFKIESSPAIGNFCSNCIRLERSITDLKKKLQREKDKFEVREKHIRQLDTLLQIKDKRLKEEELSLASERQSLSYEIGDLKKSLQDMQQDRHQTENEKKILTRENSNLVLAMKKAEGRIAELQKSLKKYEDEKKANEDSMKNTVMRNLEARENAVKAKESEIMLEYQKINYENELIDEKNYKLTYFEQNLLIQEQSIKLKYEELSSYSNELERTKAKIQQEQRKFEEETAAQIANFKAKENSLATQEKAFKSKLSMLDLELDSLEALKIKLHEQKVLLDKEINNYKNLQLEIIREPMNSSEMESESNAYNDEKERYIEEMIERLNEEEIKFAERVNGFKKTEENIKRDLEYYKNRCEELEQKGTSKDYSQIVDIEYQEKLISLQAKEEELVNMENHLNKEREDIDATADLVKSLNEDLQEQKKVQDEEYERINKEKEKIVELLKKQEERAKTLAQKEQELMSFHERLIEMEKKISQESAREDVINSPSEHDFPES
ncbi:hypothetical protein SteCoe_11039 [Stentor coeruleus]|uniref:Uncharacterized protein n=1 Tax=Stentor coeruleus TaxID=5963 RepID=A0A1R2CE35_9CILI|nr:hypothetical protein SteCoe_11039 [Stentor coeruleus]